MGRGIFSRRGLGPAIISAPQLALPFRFPGNERMLLDAFNPANLTLRPTTQTLTAATSGNANSQYLVGAQNLDLSGTQTTVIEINRNLYSALTNAGTTLAYFSTGRFQQAGRQGLLIRSLSSSTYSLAAQLNFWFWTATSSAQSSGGAGWTFSTVNAPIDWGSAIVRIVLSGSGGPVISVYWDGTAADVYQHANTSAIPSVPQWYLTGQTVPPAVGAGDFGTSSANYLNQADVAFGPMRVWTADIVAIYGAGIVATVWNGGAPLDYAALPSSVRMTTAPVAAWDMRTSPNVPDQTANGNTLTMQGSAPYAPENLVMAATERSRAHHVLKPLSFFRAWRWRATSPFNNLPSFFVSPTNRDGNGNALGQGGSCPIGAPFTTDVAGSAFTLTRMGTPPTGTDSFFLWSLCCNGQSSPTSHGLIHMIQFATSAHETGLSGTHYRDNFQGTDLSGQIQSNNDLAAATNYLLEQKAIGTGGVPTSWTFIQNGTAEATDTLWEGGATSGLCNAWAHSSTALDTFCFNGLNYNPGTTATNSGVANDWWQGLASGYTPLVYIYGSQSTGNLSPGDAGLPAAAHAAVSAYIRSLVGM